MESIGLMRSNTGAPGGKKAGQQMMGYPIKGGAFLKVTKQLIANAFKPTYYDRDELRAGVRGAADGDDDGKDQAPVTRERIKYRCGGCGGCGAQAWGKPGLALGGLDCAIAFDPA